VGEEKGERDTSFLRKGQQGTKLEWMLRRRQ
jgi:hypothetical protein